MGQLPSDTATLPWETYLTGKKTPAIRFLAKMEAARAKGGLTIPDDVTKRRFAEALLAKSDRVARLVALLQMCVPYSDTVRHIVVEFAEAGIKRLGIINFPEPLDAKAFSDAVSAWLNSLRKKPLKPVELNLLYLFLHFGYQRQLLDHETAFRLVGYAVTRPAKLLTKQSPIKKPFPNQLDVLLTTAPAVPVLLALLAYAAATKTEANKLNDQIQSQAEEIARLSSECANLNVIIPLLRDEIATLKSQKSAKENKVTELEKEIVEVRGSYQHKLDDLRGRIRGMLQGQLTRWLQTALDASRSDPPWNQAIQERLEDALKLIGKEIQWLQPSV